ncbi:MAG: hypothetical protein AAAB13_20750 [Pseudomonas sp.]
MIPCSLKTIGECACPTDRCSVQPPKAQEAPIRFSVRDQLMVCAFIGVIAGIAAFAVAARAEPYLKNQNLANQENVNVYSR